MSRYTFDLFCRELADGYFMILVRNDTLTPGIYRLVPKPLDWPDHIGEFSLVPKLRLLS